MRCDMPQWNTAVYALCKEEAVFEGSSGTQVSFDLPKAQNREKKSYPL